MSDFATDNCNDGMKRVAFLNPVLLNPWRSVVPLEFCKRFHSCGNYVKCASSSKKVRGYLRKPSRRDRYVVHINKLHPEITKTKIRAALTLCDGNVMESINLLNACLRKLNKRTLSSPSILIKDLEDELHSPEAIYLKTDVNHNSICIYNSTEEQVQVPPLGSFPKCSGVTPISHISPFSSISSASSDKRTTVTAESSLGSEKSLNVYEFNDSDNSECCTYNKIARTPPIKIGVVLKRNVKGKYTVTIM